MQSFVIPQATLRHDSTNEIRWNDSLPTTDH